MNGKPMVDVNTTDSASEVTQYLRSLEGRGSRRLVAQLIDSLMSDSSGQMDVLRKAAANGDREVIFRAAHSLQGSVAIVGGESVARVCAELVKSAREGSFEQINALVAQVKSGIDGIRKALVGWDDEKRGREGFSPDTSEKPSRPLSPISPASACWSSTTTPASARSRRCW